jgi:zinc and cadmium transporter
MDGMTGPTLWGWTLLSVTVVSLVSLVGVFTLALREEKIDQITHLLVSLAVGALFGDAILHLIPESFSTHASQLLSSLLIVAGILLFFIIEKFLRWRHCHIPLSSGHLHPVVTLNIMSDSVHNFIDGVLIAASFSISLSLGFSTTLAILLHEIPQEIGDFGVLVRGGMTPKRALAFNFFSALTALLGAMVALLVGIEFKEPLKYLIPVTAGGFLYIAGSDLIPELHQEVRFSSSLLQLILMILGISIMILLTFLA